MVAGWILLLTTIDCFEPWWKLLHWYIPEQFQQELFFCHTLVHDTAPHLVTLIVHRLQGPMVKEKGPAWSIRNLFYLSISMLTCSLSMPICVGTNNRLDFMCLAIVNQILQFLHRSRNLQTSRQWKIVTHISVCSCFQIYIATKLMETKRECFSLGFSTPLGYQKAYHLYGYLPC